MAAAAAANSLPDEIVQQILRYLTPRDVALGISLASKHFNDLANEPLLWRYYCRTTFTYWDAKHHIHHSFNGPVNDVDWKALYASRCDVDRQTTRTLDRILAGQIGRIEKFEKIAKFGYDAKDTLLRHCKTPDTADDVLSRRYYANEVLDHIHRSIAIRRWAELARGNVVSLEQALGAFDMFILHDEHGDWLEISDIFDGLVAEMRCETPGLDGMTPRKRALEVVRFLRARNLTGVNSKLAYRDLQNNYIGIALQDPEHPSLPLISVAIFCAVAERLGLDVKCCGFPAHVYAIVNIPTDENMESEDHIPTEPMFLDPFDSDDEVALDYLQTKLRTEWGLRDQEKYLAPASTTSMVLRTGMNILHTVRAFRRTGGGDDTNTGHPTISLHANPFADMATAYYSALWSRYLLEKSNEFIQFLLQQFEERYPMDAPLLEQHVLPSTIGTRGDWDIRLSEAIRVVRAGDGIPKQIRARDTVASRENVAYKVGQVFLHRRYGYLAVITGWDVECGADSQWIEQNLVDALHSGRKQSFYHALVEDTTVRYVAQENIEIVESEEPTTLMGLAGQYFKRWDSTAHKFVSNITDEYPDD